MVANQLHNIDYYQPLDKFDNALKKIFTFNNVAPADYEYNADIYGTNVDNLVKTTNSKNI